MIPGQIKLSWRDRVLAFTSYLWILSVVILFTSKNKFVHDHAKQGTLTFIGVSFPFFALFIPIINILVGLPAIVISLISLVLLIIGAIKALSGEEWKVPFIGKWWDRQIKSRTQ